MKNLSLNVPVYVTRKTADGYTGEYGVPLWLSLSVLLVVMLNALGWGVYGLVELVLKVVGS